MLHKARARNARPYGHGGVMRSSFFPQHCRGAHRAPVIGICAKYRICSFTAYFIKIYYMYYHNVFQPLMFRLHIDHTPHCCRHTTISLLAEAHVDQTTIKKIVGHSGAMSLTERIYTHLDVPALVEAINQI